MLNDLLWLINWEHMYVYRFPLVAPGTRLMENRNRPKSLGIKPHGLTFGAVLSACFVLCMNGACGSESWIIV